MSDGTTEYKTFMDGLVEIVQAPSVAATRLRRGTALFTPVVAEDKWREKYNRLASELTQEQRELVADLIQEERQPAVADVLSFMTWKKYRLVRGGVELADEPFGTESNYDLICRLQGDPWPNEGKEE